MNNPVTSRVLSYMISELNPMFCFPFCTFGISKCKETTARAVIHNITDNEHILTIENSFLGAKVNGVLQIYDPITIGEICKSVMEALHKYFSNN
jgi:hypothetical protein